MLPGPELTISRRVRLPDELRLGRYRRAPELGPRVLLFSGGTALRELAQVIPAYTHNSIHLITPFDSGGSSAKLRAAFGMLSVGDLRNRLMALADKSVAGHPEIVRLFGTRFADTGDNDAFRARLGGMIRGEDALVQDIPDPMRKIVRNHLDYFLAAAPADLDLRGASIGNLVLVGGYLNNAECIDPVIFIFSRLAEVRGLVRPIIPGNLHLAVELEDGSTVIGQHRFTGKAGPPIRSPIRTLMLNHGLDELRPAEVTIQDKVAAHIEEADLICYPMGSFYSSILANLLPQGVGSAIARCRAPKIYVPNTVGDPEQLGLTIDSEAAALIEAARGSGAAAERGVLDYVLIDRNRGVYDRALDERRLAELGVRLVEAELVTAASAPFVDAERLARVLLSLT